MFIDESNYERNMGYFNYRGQKWRVDQNGRSSKGKVPPIKHFRRALVLMKRLVSHLR